MMGITIAITMGIDDDRDYDRDDDWLRNKRRMVPENDAPHHSPALCASEPGCISKNQRYGCSMSSQRYIYWEDGNQFLGYFEEFPEYWTQGESMDDLKDQLTDLYRDLTSGQIPGIRRVGELQVS